MDETLIESLVNAVARLDKRVKELEARPDDNVIVKTTTGDPTGYSGLRVINTFDNTYRVYADAAWRTIITW